MTFKPYSRVKPPIQALRLKSGGTPLCRESFYFNVAFMCTANVPEVPEIIPSKHLKGKESVVTGQHGV